MSARRSPDQQFDLFAPYVSDLPLRDQRETMERPFFALSKRKRLQPIRYISPDGSVFVDVFPNQEFGMATIWDADILIWAASVMNRMRHEGRNDLPRTLQFQAYDLLTTIGRDSGGREYKLLRDALGRLQSTTIKTNIRPKGRKKERQFSWIESWTDVVNEETGHSMGMTLTVSEWFYEGILMEGGLLSIDSAYFRISGGRERWLYRVARKHAGGSGDAGFAISFPTLFEKSGAEGTYRRFKFEMLRIISRNELPGFDLALEATAGKEPALRMIRRPQTAPTPLRSKRSRAGTSPRQKAAAGTADPQTTLPQEQPFDTLPVRLAVSLQFPAADVEALHEDFMETEESKNHKKAETYLQAFHDFVKKSGARAASF